MAASAPARILTFEPRTSGQLGRSADGALELDRISLPLLQCLLHGHFTALLLRQKLLQIHVCSLLLVKNHGGDLAVSEVDLLHQLGVNLHFLVRGQ